MRTWLYNRLVNNPSLGPVFGTRVFQSESITTVNIPKPFIVYTIGNNTGENLSDESGGPERQFFQVYVHDEGGDYEAIDNAVKVIKEDLDGASSPADDILQVYYLETSGDQDDTTLGTIFRYIRFQAVKSRS